MAGSEAGKTRRRLVRAALAVGAAGFAVLAYAYLTLPDVRVLAATNPSSTAFMERRAVEAAREGRTTRRVQQWVPYSRISQSLKRAVLVAEDAAFWEHEGIDVVQIRESIQASWEQGHRRSRLLPCGLSGNRGCAERRSHTAVGQGDGPLREQRPYQARSDGLGALGSFLGVWRF